MLRGGVVLACVLALSACDGAKECDAMFVPAVSLSLVDGQGAPAPVQAVVTWTLDGGAQQPCDFITKGTYLCGDDTPGLYQVDAQLEGWEPASTVVDVALDDDECHVQQQAVELVLSDPCVGTTPQPSVQITLLNQDEVPVTNATVTFVAEELGAEVHECVAIGENTHQCGEDVLGDFVIFSVADGYFSAYWPVTVESDGCHAATVDIAGEMIGGA